MAPVVRLHRKARPHDSVARRPPPAPPSLPPSSTTEISPLATTRTSKTPALPPNHPRVSRYCSVNPLRSTKQRNSMGNGKSGQTTISVRSSRRGDSFDGAPPARRGVGLRIAVGVVKDVGVVGPTEVPVTVYLGAGLRDSGGQQKQRSLMRGPAASDVGASSRGAAYDCAYACCALGSCGSWWKEARENTRWNGSRPTADVCVCICSSHSPDVAYEVPLGITSDRFGLLSTTTTYTVTTNSNPGWLIWM